MDFEKRDEWMPCGEREQMIPKRPDCLDPNLFPVQDTQDYPSHHKKTNARLDLVQKQFP